MERVKHLRGGRGGCVGVGGREGGEGAALGRRGVGGTYRGDRFSRGSKVRTRSDHRDQSKLDFTRKSNISKDTAEKIRELDERNAVVGFSNDVTDNKNIGLATSDFHMSPKKKYDEKMGLASCGVSSTEASEYCKSQGSSQNPSPMGGCQEKFSSSSNFYNSKHSSSYKHFKRNNFQNAIKGRRMFEKTQNGKILGMKRIGFEKSSPVCHSTEKMDHIQEIESLSNSGDVSELPTTDKNAPDQDERNQEIPNNTPEKEPNFTEPSSNCQDENCRSNCTNENASSKPSSRIVGDIISWMMERQGEAIQWLKENGKYPQMNDTQNLEGKPQKCHQEGYKEKKQAWSRTEQFLGGRNQSFPLKYKSYKKNASSELCSSHTLTNPTKQDNNSTSENLGLTQEEISEQSNTNISFRSSNQKPESHSKQRFEYNRMFSRENGGSFHFHNKTKERESDCHIETGNNSKYREKSTGRTGGFNHFSKYRNHNFRKQSTQ